MISKIGPQDIQTLAPLHLCVFALKVFRITTVKIIVVKNSLASRALKVARAKVPP
jgi:hypothetical protein